MSGVDELAAAVAPFTPESVARRADIDRDDLVPAARIFASGQRGFAELKQHDGGRLLPDPPE